MRQQTWLVFCIYRDIAGPCVLQDLINKATKLCGLAGHKVCTPTNSQILYRPVLALRILNAKNTENGYMEVWARVSGDAETIDALEQILKREKGFAYQVLEKTRHSALLRILVPHEGRCRACMWCPLQGMPAGSMLKSLIVTADYMLIGALIAKQHSLRELMDRGCIVIERIESDEAGYALTDKQEYVLVTAFLEGYYSYPRKISAKELAAKLRISSSALTELLRRAELKIITKFIIEEIPHYLVSAILARKGLLKEEKILEKQQ